MYLFVFLFLFLRLVRYLNDFTDPIHVNVKNTEMTAMSMLVFSANPVRVECFSCVKISFVIRN